MTQEGMLDAKLALGFRVVEGHGPVVHQQVVRTPHPGTDCRRAQDCCQGTEHGDGAPPDSPHTKHVLELAVQFPNLPNTGPLRELADLKPHLRPLLSFLTPSYLGFSLTYTGWRQAPVCREEVRQSPAMVVHALLQDAIPLPALSRSCKRRPRPLRNDSSPAKTKRSKKHAKCSPIGTRKKAKTTSGNHIACRFPGTKRKSYSARVVKGTALKTVVEKTRGFEPHL